MAKYIFPLLIFTVCLTTGGLTFRNIWAQEKLVASFSEALKKQNAEKLEALVDWHNIRAKVKTDLKDTADTIRSISGGNAIGPRQDQIDRIVDYYLQPENIILLFKFRNNYFPGKQAEDFIHKTGFRGLNGIKIVFGLPRQENPAGRIGREVTAYFRPVNGKWRLVDMDIPMFMVPRKTYNVPAHKLEVDFLIQS